MKKLIQLFRQTFIYGIATVFPRVISVLLVRLHTDKEILESVSDYGNLSLIFSYIILFNVILSYGLETSFFRFFSKESNKKEVLSTSSISIVFTTILFYAIASIFKELNFIPTGGINESNVHSFLELQNVLCVGTSKFNDLIS